MLNETNIACFLKLAETLSFTDTAKRMYLTQQAVSKNITNLENEMGFPLFFRTAKGITLTPEGEECQRLFRQMEADYTAKVTQLRERIRQTSPTLLVGYQNYLELGVGIVKANNALRERDPASQVFGVRYSPGELGRRLADGSLDLIIICMRYFVGGAEYEGQELFRVPCVIMVSPDNPNVMENATYMDFRFEPYIVDRFEGESTADFNRRVKSEIDMCRLSPAEVISVPNRDSAYIAAELGNGILLGSEISQMAQGSRLLRYRTETRDSISCFWRKNEPKKNVLQYVEYLKQAYGV